MKSTYIFSPNNFNLRHCSESFYFALNKLNTSHLLEVITTINLHIFLLLLKKIITLKLDESISIFLFAKQFNYLFLLFCLKLTANIFRKRIKVYYLMHEPRYEKGRINPYKAGLVYYYNLLISYIADKIFIPSNEASIRAHSFIDESKLLQVNLTFISPSDNLLKTSLISLVASWDTCKTFSLLGRTAKDKNPQGFLSLANIINKNYTGSSRFIRAGNDQGVCIDYNEELITHFPGYISDSAKKFLFSMTHFIVIPYAYSTQSGVIAEALSYGKLLIVNDISSFAYLRGLDFVFFVDFNNENSIIDCLKLIFSMKKGDYKELYWSAVKYFIINHSEVYLSNKLNTLVL